MRRRLLSLDKDHNDQPVEDLITNVTCPLRVTYGESHYTSPYLYSEWILMKGRDGGYGTTGTFNLDFTSSDPLDLQSFINYIRGCMFLIMLKYEISYIDNTNFVGGNTYFWGTFTYTNYVDSYPYLQYINIGRYTLVMCSHVIIDQVSDYNPNRYIRIYTPWANDYANFEVTIGSYSINMSQATYRYNEDPSDSSSANSIEIDYNLLPLDIFTGNYDSIKPGTSITINHPDMYQSETFNL